MIGGSLKLRFIPGLGGLYEDTTTRAQIDALVSGVEAPVRHQIWPLRGAIQRASINKTRRTRHAI